MKLYKLHKGALIRRRINLNLQHETEPIPTICDWIIPENWFISKEKLGHMNWCLVKLPQSVNGFVGFSFTIGKSAILEEIK